MVSNGITSFCFIYFSADPAFTYSMHGLELEILCFIYTKKKMQNNAKQCKKTNKQKKQRKIKNYSCKT